MQRLPIATLTVLVCFLWESMGLPPQALVMAAVTHPAPLIFTSSPPNPQGHLSRGKQLILQKEFFEAVAELKASLALDPDNEQIYLALAQAYIGLEQLDKAEAILNKAFQEINATVSLSLAQGDLAFIQGRHTEAETAYREALQLDPDHDGPYLTLGRLFMATNQWKPAQNIYQQWADRKPQSEHPQIFLGEFYAFMGAGSQALEHFQQALAINPQSVNARNHLINFYLDNHRWDEAKPLIDAGISADPQDVNLQVLEGRLWLGQGNTDEAMSRFHHILERAPDQAMAHHYLGVAYALKKEIPQAVQSLTTASTLAPQDRHIRKTLAWVRMLEGSWDLAIEEAHRAIQLNPRDVQTVHFLGEAYLRKQDVTQAKKVYQSIIEQIPQDPLAHYQLGLIAQHDRQIQDALDHFEAALTHNPHFMEALLQIVGIRMKRSEEAQARDRVQQQIETVPDHPHLYNLLGSLWLQANHPDKAEQAFKRSLQLDDRLLAPYMNLAELYRQTNRLDAAVQEYKRVLEKNPRVASAHMLLGMIEEEQEDFEQAERHFRATLDIDPHFAPAANNLAWLLAEHGGNLTEALSYAKLAYEQQPENPYIADTLGWVYYKQQDYSKALSHLQEAAEKAPEDPIIHYHLGMAQFKKGDRKGAKNSLEMAFRLKPDFPGSEEARTTLDSL